MLLQCPSLSITRMKKEEVNKHPNDSSQTIVPFIALFKYQVLIISTCVPGFILFHGKYFTEPAVYIRKVRAGTSRMFIIALQLLHEEVIVETQCGQVVFPMK